MARADTTAPTSQTLLASPRTGPMNVLFTATILLSALLLFAVEPMVAKMLLPPYGGAAAVWTTSLLFFQTVLLIGYAYAHFAPRWLGRWHPPIHVALVLLPLVLLPITLPSWAAPGQSGTVVGWLLLVLTAMVGLPFLLLSTTGPLVQSWYATLGLPRSHDPYFLYAASNIGSMGALLAYPFLIEPLLRVQNQSLWWALAYAAFAVLIITCALTARRHRDTPAAHTQPEHADTGTPTPPSDDAPTPTSSTPATAPAPTWRRRLRWLALAALPSSLMQGVTTYMTTDVAAIPLLWVLPLAVYLATFIISFGLRRHTWVPATVDTAVIGTLPLIMLWTLEGTAPLLVAMALSTIMLGVVALAAHGLLAQDRPKPAHLTEFFLLVSLGGALGSLFNAVAAPLLFDRVLEYPLALAAAALLPLATPHPSRLVRTVAARSRTRVTLLVCALPVGALVLPFLDSQIALTVLVLGAFVLTILVGFVLVTLLARQGVRAATFAGTGMALVVVFQFLSGGSVVHDGRSFFGAYKIYEESGKRYLTHGSTIHGFQSLDPRERGKPMSYYAESGPLGDVFDAHGSQADNVGTVGLGTGAVAAYGKPRQRFDFYEIDPEMVRVASNREWFTYLSDCACETNTIVGDGRLELAKAPDGRYDIIVMDAFNSDAPPAHLLTREGLTELSEKLAPGGLMAVHVSNRTLDLTSTVGATTKEAGLPAVRREFANTDAEGREIDKDATASQWVVVARDEKALGALTERSPHAAHWRPVSTDGPVWTDSYSSLAGILR